MLHKVISNFESLETKLGNICSSLIVGLVGLVLAILYCAPLKNMQMAYVQMSVDPFDYVPHNQYILRPLTPLLAHLVGLGGGRYIWFSLCLIVVFLSLIYFLSRRRGLDVSSALMVVGTMIVTTPICYALAYPGRTDITFYSLILGCLVVPLPAVSLLFSLSLLNNEASIFYIAPVLARFFGRSSPIRYRLVSLVFLLLGLAVVWCMREEMKLRAVGFYYSETQYLNLDHIVENLRLISGLAPLAILMSFRLMWFIPILAVRRLYKEHRFHAMIMVLLPLVASVGSVTVAHDTSRLIGHGFACIILGSWYLFESWGSHRFVSILGKLLLGNLLLPNLYVGSKLIQPLLPTPIAFLLELLGVGLKGPYFWW